MVLQTHSFGTAVLREVLRAIQWLHGDGSSTLGSDILTQLQSTKWETAQGFRSDHSLEEILPDSSDYGC